MSIPFAIQNGKEIRYDSSRETLSIEFFIVFFPHPKWTTPNIQYNHTVGQNKYMISIFCVYCQQGLTI